MHRNVRPRIIHILLGCILLVSSFPACKVTKFVPEGEYLLDKVEIKTDGQDIKKDDLERYVRQTPNTAVFGVWRMPLRLYSMAGRDTARWHNRVLQRAGEAPVIYNPTQTYLSEQSLEKALQNRGYMHAEVSSTVELDRKRARVTYTVDSREPYRLRRYETDLPDPTLRTIAADPAASLVQADMLFDVDVLNAERDRISREFRERGYYRFNKEMLAYEADSALHSHRVDLKLHLRELDPERGDSLYRRVFRPYYIRNIVFFTGREAGLHTAASLDRTPGDFDMAERDGYMLVSGKDEFLRPGVLLENTFIEPGSLYTDRAVEQTYTALNALAPVKYVNIGFREVGETDSLDCLVTVAPAKFFSLQGDLEATYTDGYWGVAANLGTTHRNMFRGAETLSLQGRLAYEWQGKDAKGNTILANELGLQAGLTFPNLLLPLVSEQFKRRVRATTQFTADVNSQRRPGEFSVMRFGVGMEYGWSRSQLRHTLELFDISYVDFDVTDEFRKAFLDTKKFNPYNYESHFITRIGYTGSYSTFNPARPLRNHLSMRYSVETAGNVLHAISTLARARRNDEGFYTVVGDIPYSQYVRGDFNVTFHHIFDENNRFVYHFFAGAGLPYGNGSVIPYERRYYSGGANSVRGWAESTLGPGVYRRDNISRRGRDYNQIGDIKLDLNLEYRFKMFAKLDGALFVDAGNIWTVRPYETQPGGEFRFDSFLNQLGVSYGLGLRLDFSFLVVRLDLGVKLHDPALEPSQRWRTDLNRNDFALHFAIGYPF